MGTRQSLRGYRERGNKSFHRLLRIYYLVIKLCSSYVFIDVDIYHTLAFILMFAHITMLMYAICIVLYLESPGEIAVLCRHKVVRTYPTSPKSENLECIYIRFSNSIKHSSTFLWKEEGFYTFLWRYWRNYSIQHFMFPQQSLSFW